jgi:hypothetical protein
MRRTEFGLQVRLLFKNFRYFRSVPCPHPAAGQRFAGAVPAKRRSASYTNA